MVTVSSLPHSLDPYLPHLSVTVLRPVDSFAYKRVSRSLVPDHTLPSRTGDTSTLQKGPLTSNPTVGFPVRRRFPTFVSSCGLFLGASVPYHPSPRNGLPVTSPRGPVSYFRLRRGLPFRDYDPVPRSQGKVTLLPFRRPVRSFYPRRSLVSPSLPKFFIDFRPLYLLNYN